MEECQTIGKREARRGNRRKSGEWVRCFRNKAEEMEGILFTQETLTRDMWPREEGRGSWERETQENTWGKINKYIIYCNNKSKCVF